MTRSSKITNNMTFEQRARKGCTCEGCGLDYYGDLIVPDEVWAEIADSRELLCGACITDAIVLRGIWTAARVTDIDALQAQQPDLSEAGLAALRSIKPGETLTQEQWDGVCEYVREQEAVLDGYKAEIELRAETQQPGAQAVAPEVAVAWEVCAAVNGNIWRRVYSEEEFKEYTDAGWKGRRLFEKSA